MPSTLPGVSASSHTDPAQSSASDGDLDVPASGETEEVDAVPVLADGSTGVVRAYPPAGELASPSGSAAAMIPTVQAAAVAASGFVAGAAFVGLVHRRHRRSAALTKGRKAGRSVGRGKRGRRATPTAGELVQIVGSRSLLVDVHLLGGRD
jgi:hypothetical protein